MFFFFFTFCWMIQHILSCLIGMSLPGQNKESNLLRGHWVKYDTWPHLTQITKQGWKWPFALGILMRKQFSGHQVNNNMSFFPKLSQSINSWNVKACVFISNMGETCGLYLTGLYNGLVLGAPGCKSDLSKVCAGLSPSDPSFNISNDPDQGCSC